jgi:transposase
MLGLNRNTTDRFYHLFREKIAMYQETQLKKMRGHIEIDESYFGSRHSHDPRGRSTKRKIPVIGLLKRNGKMYTQIIKDASETSIVPILERLIEKSKANVYTDGWSTYDSLVWSGYKHHRINHSKEFARGHNHINGIESFWSYVKRKMRKHNGIARHKFYLYLKESEFRFNHRGEDLYPVLQKVVFKR